jgi:hypothetical protein
MEETSNASLADQVIVTVDASGVPSCSPHVLPVNGSDAVLKFSLQTAGYVFPTDGAVVVNSASEQFPFPSRTLPSGSWATLYDRNTAAGTFGYTMSVKNAATGEIGRVDPTINNGG